MTNRTFVLTDKEKPKTKDHENRVRMIGEIMACCPEQDTTKRFALVMSLLLLNKEELKKVWNDIRQKANKEFPNNNIFN